MTCLHHDSRRGQQQACKEDIKQREGRSASTVESNPVANNRHVRRTLNSGRDVQQVLWKVTQWTATGM